MMLLCTFLHLQIHFQIIVFVFPIFAVSVEKTPQAYCDENHAWCEDVVSSWQALDSHLPTLYCKLNSVDGVHCFPI